VELARGTARLQIASLLLVQRCFRWIRLAFLPRVPGKFGFFRAKQVAFLLNVLGGRG
jgi:hypothetical protein